MNIDPLEIQKFDEMATDWWDKSGPCKPLHDLNPIRLDFILSHCSIAKGTQVLDIGCGGGILTEALSQFSTSVWGLDQSEKALEVAKNHAQTLSHPPRYEQSTAEAFAKIHPGNFDLITCMELLEHVPDPLSIINACGALLKPGGQLFFSTLNRTPKSFLFAIVGAEYLLKLLPRGTHTYERFIRPSELAQWSRSRGLSLKHIKGISYNLFSKAYYLSHDVSVNYLMHFEKE
ncbi:MAG: bifunctional 2-polyprenyl-6-hydroxyphenol methylase/3-demethylubiquinol 3-O-methyltransferase UbiG [Proteobacteria bacterium]|nr:bifunctional 2-polyprenyl-6-hydroxyphenol methylase/3-demethylubiquinol 3-O-methyltransferase UbiG [Pseudomonadota bacterium]